MVGPPPDGYGRHCGCAELNGAPAGRSADPSTTRRRTAETGARVLIDRFDDVLDAARGGDDDAWAEIYRDLAPVLLGYLRGHGASDPDDLVGEVLLQVVRHIETFEGDERGFRSWVFTIAHRRLIDRRRRHQRHPEDLAPVEDLEPVLPATEDEPEALAALGAEEVVALLGRLTDDQREVLLLRLVGGLRLPEVAEVTGRPPQAVKSLQKRGIEQLRRLLGRSVRRGHGAATQRPLVDRPLTPPRDVDSGA